MTTGQLDYAINREKRRIMNKAIQYLKPCQQCWKTFQPKHQKQRYCSEECAKIIQKQQTQKWIKSTNRTNRSTRGTATYTAYYKLRFQVFQRDGFTCQYCGRNAQAGAVLNVDHIKPKNKGGEYEISNLVTSCQECNLGKGDILLSARQMKKLKESLDEIATLEEKAEETGD